LAVVIGSDDFRPSSSRKALKSLAAAVARFVRTHMRMTQPRFVLPGDTVMITRRTLRRHHLFRPDPAIRQLYLYTLAVCAKQFGILVHAVTLMSTHEHLIVTDTEGRFPLFLRELHRLVSLGTKVLRKWEGPTWDHEQTSVVRLLTERAIVEKLAYLMVNPVRAGLVRQARDWPGITVLPQELGRRTWTLGRPDAYFRADNPQWPETVELSLMLPPVLARRYAAQELREAVDQELERQERHAHQEVRKRGWRFLGAERVRRLSPYRRATSFELLRDRNPTFAVGRGQKRAFFEAVAELRAFRRAYRDALEQWRAGLRTVVFPQGTWCMCRAHGVVVQT
jgi:REP element-mobilizing transposase RayT